MFAVGSSNTGTLFVPPVGDSLGRILESHTNHQSLVFGRLINKGDFAMGA